jgi:1-deoxy-D-xylulose-5-phosphate reductoisomerase
MKKKKRIILLGATGSIGDNTLEVVRGNREHLEIIGIAAHTHHEKLARIAREFEVPHVALFNEAAHDAAAKSGSFAKETQFYAGLDGLTQLARIPEADTVISAIVGTQGLGPTLAAIEAGKNIALANKEILVLAGKFVMEAARKHAVTILPLDSEHNAIFQCLQGAQARHVDRLILTASGGMFRTYSMDDMRSITPEETLRHPNWTMGKKVTIDCSTLANKGLELIEAHWLFDMPESAIDIVVHPQSIIHSMVRFVDGSTLAQLAPPSMTFAIQNSLLYPERTPAVSKPLDFTKALSLEFFPPDLARFPALRLAREALHVGGTAPAAFNAANEIAVQAFFEKRVSFLDIPSIIESTLEKVPHFDPSDLLEVLSLDEEARQTALEAAALINPSTHAKS